MAGCGCKKDKNNVTILENNVTNENVESTFNKVIKYTLKFIGFLIMMVFLPVINLVIIWFIFRSLVLNKDVSLKPLLLAIGNKFKDPEDEDDNDDDDSEDVEYQMLDVDVIKN